MVDEFRAELSAIAEQLKELSAALRSATRRTWYQRVRFWAALAAGMTLHIGVVLALGGPRRVSAHAYEPIAQYGGPVVWGAAFMVTGVFTVVCVGWWHRMLRWALLTQAIPYAATSVSFAVTSAEYPDVILIASPMFAWVTIMHGFLSDYARKEF